MEPGPVRLKEIRLKVNGIERSFNGNPDMPVLWYLRDILGLTGTKFGCGMAQCGACTVHQNGESIRSCVVPIRSVSGAEITTMGLTESPENQPARTCQRIGYACDLWRDDRTGSPGGAEGYLSRVDWANSASSPCPCPNPGLGTKSLGKGISYARARDGARVFFRQVGNKIEIVGKASKANEPAVINYLKTLY